MIEWYACNKMKYSMQLLYIVLAIYLSFMAQSVDAMTAVSYYYNKLYVQ